MNPILNLQSLNPNLFGSLRQAVEKEVFTNFNICNLLKLILGEKPKIPALTCCKIVAMFRCVHPTAEIRLAAGREHYLGPLQSMALMAANSLFMNGYLNIKGSDIHETIALIETAGYSVDADIDLSNVKNAAKTHHALAAFNDTLTLKSKEDLHVTPQ